MKEGFLPDFLRKRTLANRGLRPNPPRFPGIQDPRAPVPTFVEERFGHAGVQTTPDHVNGTGKHVRVPRRIHRPHPELDGSTESNFFRFAVNLLLSFLPRRS